MQTFWCWQRGIKPYSKSHFSKAEKAEILGSSGSAPGIQFTQYHTTPITLIDALEYQEQSFLNVTTQPIEEGSPITEIFINGFSVESFLKLNVEDIKCTSKEMENDILTLVNTWMNSTGQSYSEASTGNSLI